MMRDGEILDLTIGAWLRLGDKAVMVGSIDYTKNVVKVWHKDKCKICEMKELTAIPIGQYLLVKAGFDTTAEDTYFFYWSDAYSISLARLQDVTKEGDKERTFSAATSSTDGQRYMEGKIKYLHELQAMLRWCRVDEIEFDIRDEKETV